MEYVESKIRTGHFSRVLLLAAVVLLTTGAAYAISSLERKWALFCFLGFLFPFVLALARDVKKMLLGLLVFSLPLNIDYNFIIHPSPGGANYLSLGLVDILLFALFCYWLIQIACARGAVPAAFFPAITWPTLALISLSLLSMLAATDLLWSVFDILNMVKTLLFFLVLANVIQDRRDLSVVLGALFFGLLLQTLFTALQFYKGVNIGLNLYGIGEPDQVLSFGMNSDNVARPGGTIGHCNHLARYFGLLLPVSVVLSLTHESARMRLFSAAVSYAGVLGLIYTLTRSSWIGLTGSFAVMFPLLIVRKLMNLRTIKKLLLGGAVLMILLFAFHDIILGRVLAYDFGSARTRITTARVAWRIIQDHPIIGVGINNYGTMLERYWDSEDPFTRRSAVHNTYLLYAAEIGLLGFGAYLWLLIAAFSRIKKAIRSRCRLFAAVSIGIMGSYAAYLMTALSDKSHKESFTLLLVFWGLLAITEAMNRFNSEYDRMSFDILSSKRWIHEL